MTPLQSRIEKALREKLQPVYLSLEDESAKHALHLQKGAGGHLALTLVSEEFAGKSLMARHQTIYALLKEELKEEIHALGIKAYTPAEWLQKQKTDK